MPTAFDLARIVAVYKTNGKDTGDPDNYRPIALLQTCYKLYTTLLLNRLKQGISDRVHKYQYGFQKKLSVDNAVFSILRAVELAHSYKNWPLYVLLLDWAKAYDKVNIGRMLKALRRLGFRSIPLMFWRAYTVTRILSCGTGLVNPSRRRRQTASDRAMGSAATFSFVSLRLSC